MTLDEWREECRRALACPAAKVTRGKDSLFFIRCDACGIRIDSGEERDYTVKQFHEYYTRMTPFEARYGG